MNHGCFMRTVAANAESPSSKVRRNLDFLTGAKLSAGLM